MAWITTAEVKTIRDQLKKTFPNLKFSVSGGNSLKLHVAIMKGDQDFSDILDGRTSIDINQYWLGNYGHFTKLFEQIYTVMRGADWYDKSDASTDYFDTAYYMSLKIGKWDKPYEFVG